MGGGGLRRQRYGGGHDYRRLAVMSNCSSSDCVHDEESSSSEDGTGVVRRKSHLDDALFEFFSKQAIKSLKRDFSKFCRDSDMWAENKRPKFSGVDKKCFSVYSFKYFLEVLNRLTVEQSAIIEKFGFGCLLCLSKTYTLHHLYVGLLGPLMLIVLKSLLMTR
ncbi:uncharacterized protein LOC124683629 [Lolium rigidum]|uniref:uncharacterized protein LOC124683629 n=1 Tax=Lolium rigidum TaxID=89674 RepID=UPI001F5DFAB1|nr:uncharacterized protein LOC124683629 [Lolium rigidum]